MTTKSSPCLKAHDIVNGVRREEYGGLSESLECAADLWSSLLSTEVSVQDVCRCMIALKLSRDFLVEKEDNLVDICGYAEIAQMLRDSRHNSEVDDNFDDFVAP